MARDVLPTDSTGTYSYVYDMDPIPTGRCLGSNNVTRAMQTFLSHEVIEAALLPEAGSEGY